MSYLLEILSFLDGSLLLSLCYFFAFFSRFIDTAFDFFMFFVLQVFPVVCYVSTLIHACCRVCLILHRQKVLEERLELLYRQTLVDVEEVFVLDWHCVVAHTLNHVAINCGAPVNHDLELEAT